MLAARVDQENFVHGQQTAAAAKPLNQNIRGLQAKTPGHKAPKTPFKVPLNDENATYGGGKTFLKTNGKIGATGKKVTLDKNAFVTPGAKVRQALGAKTTNAKANAFFTPGPKNAQPSPIKSQQKTGSPRLRRAKVKVLPAEPVAVENNDDLNEIEFMGHGDGPLREYDSDDEFGPNKEFPHLRPENLMRGINEIYCNPTDENGRYLSDIRREQGEAKLRKFEEAKLQKNLDDLFGDTEAFLMQDLGLVAPVKKESTTTLAKKAASALANPAQARKLVNSTATSKARASSALNVRKNRQEKIPAAIASNPRFAAATAASRSTVGYAQGRAVSQKVRKPVTAIFKDSEQEPKQARIVSNLQSNSPTEAEFNNLAKNVVEQLRLQNAALEGDDSDHELMGNPVAFEDDDDDFQLPMPTFE